MEHDSELAKAIHSEMDRIDDLIDRTARTLFISPDYERIYQNYIATCFDKKNSIYFDTGSYSTAIYDDNGDFICFDDGTRGYLDTDEKFSCARAYFCFDNACLKFKNGDYLEALPFLIDAAIFIGSTIEYHGVIAEKSIKAKENGTKGGQVHSKKKKDYPIVEEFWLKNRGKLTAKECATALEKTGLVESTYGEILKIITEINKKLKNSSSQL